MRATKSANEELCAQDENLHLKRKLEVSQERCARLEEQLRELKLSGADVKVTVTKVYLARLTSAIRRKT